LAAALLLLGFEAGIGLRRLLFRMVNRAVWLGANLPQLALVDTVRHNGFGRVLARFELRPLRLLRRIRLLLPDFDVLVARDCLFTLGLLLVCRADLDKLRFRGDLGFYMRIQLGTIAIRVGALCGIWANRKSFLLAPRRHSDQSWLWLVSGFAETGRALYRGLIVI
jgi:hypothetical protein